MIMNFLLLLKMNFSYLLRTVFWILIQMKRENFKNYVKNGCAGNSLIVLANGPSLSGELSSICDELENSDVCVVNEFCKSPFYEKIKPAIYVLADPMYFYDELMRASDEETIEIISKTGWKMEVYVPFSVFKNAKKKMESSFVRVIPYHTNPYDGWSCVRNILFEKGLSMPRIQNVLIPSVFNAINLGYLNIRLYGVDHSWTQEIRVDRMNQVCLTDHHFYDEKEVSLNPWKKCNGDLYKMHEILRDLAYMFEGYYELKRYADMRNCRIYNMTKQTFIDAFERG